MKFLFEFEDLSWFPNLIRESMTDYLRFFFDATHFYEPVVPILLEGLKQTNSIQILDLCSGGGGPVEQIQRSLEKQSGRKISIILTDKFPNVSAFNLLEKKTKGSISFIDKSVDATNVPSAVYGFRTIFSGFHHFDKNTARSVLQNAVDAKEGIGIFDGADRNLLNILGIVLVHPIVFFFCTPFIRPFRFSRFLLTYFIPLIPFCTVWDGVVSILRLYSFWQLLLFTRSLEGENYNWKAGKVKNRFGINLSYLIGYPTINP